MMKKRPHKRQWILLLLLALPVGLLAGVIFGQTTDPAKLFKGRDAVSGESKATKRPNAEVARRSNEQRETGRPSSFRPDLDYEEEFWPGDDAGGRPGDPGEYGYYSGDEMLSNDALFEDDYRPGSTPEPPAGLDRRDTDSAPATTSPGPSDRYAPLRQREPAPSPTGNGEPARTRSSEPRTANGDLPAIW